MLAEVCKHKAVGSLDITHDKSVKRYNAWDLAAYTAGHGLPGSNSAVGDLCHTLVGGSSIPAQSICILFAPCLSRPATLRIGYSVNLAQKVSHEVCTHYVGIAMI